MSDDVSTAAMPGTNGAQAAPAMVPPGDPVASVQINTGPRFDMPVAVLVDMLEGIARANPSLFADHYLRATTGITGVVKGKGGRPPAS